MRAPGATNEGPPLVQMTWRVMREQAVPGSGEAEGSSGGQSRCQTLQSGAADFVQALAASRAAADEKAALSTARQAMAANCDRGEAYPWRGRAHQRGGPRLRRLSARRR